MKKQLENIYPVQSILKESRIGLWCIEMDDGKAPRIYVDETFREIMGMDPGMSPEECYRFWYGRIHEGEEDKVKAILEGMTRGQYAEALYAWSHPAKGTIYVRCGGRRDEVYRAGLRFRGSHQDVTELVEARRKRDRLLEQQEKTKTVPTEIQGQAILDALSGGVAVIRCAQDGVWTPEYLSEGFAAMVGMTMTEVWGLYRQDAMAGVHPEDRARLGQALDRYFSGGEERMEAVYRLRRGDGSYLWVRNAITTVRDENGEKKTYCVYQDISREREEKEQLRREYNERLSRHYQAAGPDVLMVGHCNISRNQVLEIVDYTNSGLFDTCGSGRDEFFADFSTVIPDEDDRRGFLSTFRSGASAAAFAKGKTELSFSSFIRLPNDAHGRYAQFKVNLVQSPDSGDLMGILTVTDVTEQTVTRKILRKLSILGCDLIADVDLYGDCQTFLTVGGVDGIAGRKVSFSGYNENAVRTYTIPQDRERLAKMLQPQYILERLSEADSYSFSYGIVNDEGRILTKHLTISAIDLRLGRVCTARRDITESIEAEQKSKQALGQALAAAEQANRAKSNFLSTMSHDIRTPLNAIIGMTSLAQSRLDDRERLVDCLNKITISSEHLLSLVNDILDMNQIERTKLVLNREEVCLTELLERVSSMFSIPAKEKGVHFTVDAQHLAGRVICGDPLRINQILINLVGNAVKFTPAGGIVELKAEEIPAEGGKNRLRCRFTVRDSGIGMPQEFLARMFDPFTRGAAAAHVEGNGLGLSITKGLVDLMGGAISVESQENRGTTFRVELEFDLVQREPEAAPAQEAGEPLPLAGWSLLQVEDNVLNSEILVDLLEEKGARMTTRENGMRGVEAFQQSAPGTYDAILMDIQMPVLNGYDATRAIRAMGRPDAKTIPIIAMSANAFAEDVRAAEEAGMNVHISKPVSIARLIRVLRELVPNKPEQTMDSPGKTDDKQTEGTTMTVEECYQAMGGNYAEVTTRIPSPALVEKFLGKFLDDPSFGQLRSELYAGNRAEAFRAAHTLKGVCVNLSFTRLQQSASDLTEVLRPAAETIPAEAFPLMEQVEQDYEATLAAIRQFLETK